MKSNIQMNLVYRIKMAIYSAIMKLNHSRDMRLSYLVSFPLILFCVLSISSAAHGAGYVIAWGYNSDGQTNVPVDAQSGVTQIAGGYLYSLALKDGKVIAWGQNEYVLPEAQSGVTQISAGASHCLALKDGKVIAWGANPDGQCNVPVEAQSGVTQIAAGGRSSISDGHSLALKDGKVIAWGYNSDGQTNVPVEAQSGVTQIAAGWNHCLALKNGKVIAWGQNYYGECDVPVEAQIGVTQIAAGAYHSLALKDGKVIAWGFNDYVPGPCTVPVEAQSGVIQIATGAFYGLALKDGKVIAWGNNYYGQCDVPVDAQTGVTQIAAGTCHGLALKTEAPPPSAPTGVSASDGEYTDKVVITWSVASGATSYEVWRYTSNNSGAASKISSPDLTGIIYDDTSATAGITYYYWVKAVNASGTSGFSLSDSGYCSTPPPEPTVIGPVIKANGQTNNVIINHSNNLNVTVQINPGQYSGINADWWIVVLAESRWYYLDNLMQWESFDGNLYYCHPVYQGPLFNLGPTTVLSEVLLPGSFTFWFVITQMDGVLDINEPMLVDSVNVIVQ